MRKFNDQHPPGPYEYRLNPQVFYLKFVKRNGALSNAGLVLPIDHFERLRADPSYKGPRGAVRVSFESLAGHYLRQGPFLDLIRAGYIGATAATAAYLKELATERSWEASSRPRKRATRLLASAAESPTTIRPRRRF